MNILASRRLTAAALAAVVTADALAMVLLGAAPAHAADPYAEGSVSFGSSSSYPVPFGSMYSENEDFSQFQLHPASWEAPAEEPVNYDASWQMTEGTHPAMSTFSTVVPEVNLDRRAYSWTDRVYITVISPDNNLDDTQIDEIGDTDDYQIIVATRGYEIDQYKLVETGTSTGIFVGEVTLTGFEYDADGDGILDTVSSGGSGSGPTDGLLGSSEDDGITVTFRYPDGGAVISSSTISWNIGEIEWLEANHSGIGTGVIRVIDDDMNLDPDAADDFEIIVWSDTHAGGIGLTVTETSLATGVFEGTVSFLLDDDMGGNNLAVSEGDTITAEYADHTLPSPYAKNDSLDLHATSLIRVSAPPPDVPETVPELEPEPTPEPEPGLDSFGDYSIPTPKQQLADGIAPKDIQCREDRILVLSPSGSPACVSESTADRIGWEKITAAINVDGTVNENEVVQQATGNPDVPEEFPIGGLDKKIVIFSENSLLAFHTDKTKYDYNETVYMHGQISDMVPNACNGDLVSVSVRHDDHPKFYHYNSTEIHPDCSYEITIDLSGSKWTHAGTYTLTARINFNGINTSTDIELVSGFAPPPQPVGSGHTVLDLSSATEFVDDGREYPRAIAHYGPPANMYDIILESYEDFYVDEKGVATFISVPHEKYSTNNGQGHYVEDWIPAFIPDGQRLLYAGTSYSTFELSKTYETYKSYIKFVPTTFTLTPFTMNHDLILSKGFSVSITHSTLPVDGDEYIIEHLRKAFIDDEKSGYGEIRKIARDGKFAVAFAGGNSVNPYQASISFRPDAFTSISVNSKYHTLDELLPIFESVMNN